MKTTSLVALLLFISCAGPKPKTETHILDFGAFTIETPKGWLKVEHKGMDSYIGDIAIDNRDTISFDLGWYSNTLAEDYPMFLERSQLPFIKKADISEYIIVDRRAGIDVDRYMKNNISWDTIDGRFAKIVYPRVTGKGTTGIYIDSLWKAGPGIDRFNLYGENLQPVNEKLVLTALKTIKFHVPKQ